MWLSPHPTAGLCLQDTVEALPELLEAVQAVLLDMLALVLANRTFRTAPPIRRAALTQALNAGASGLTAAAQVNSTLCGVCIVVQPAA